MEGSYCGDGMVKTAVRSGVPLPGMSRLVDFSAELATITLEIAQHCPCGARSESPNMRPHVVGCPVYRLLKLIGLTARSVGNAYEKAVAPSTKTKHRKQPDNWTYWMKPPKNHPPRCESTHDSQQCQKFSGHDGAHQECNEAWTHV